MDLLYLKINRFFCCTIDKSLSVCFRVKLSFVNKTIGKKEKLQI